MSSEDRYTKNQVLDINFVDFVRDKKQFLRLSRLALGIVMQKIEALVKSRPFQWAILGVIFLNSILFGLQTSQPIMAKYGRLLGTLDQICLSVFVIELALKLIVYNWRFPRDPWNVFDFLIVAVSLAPDMGMFSSLRLFRVLRIFKLVSGMRHMRIIISAILRSLPGVSWASMLLLLVYYVYGIIGTNLFGAVFPEWFGSLGKSVYSLFQIMTLESWSMGIARPVIAEFPCAWVFFVTYILLSSFIVMNIVVGIVLNSIGDSFKKEDSEEAATRGRLSQELDKLRKQLDVVEREIAAISAMDEVIEKQTRTKKEKE